MKFDNLALIEPLRRAVAAQGYTSPTPIQERAIPPLLEGRDVLGCAQTGTGKTAAFALPVLQHLAEDDAEDGPRRGRRRIRVLVMSPTRELALQIGDSFEAYGKHLPYRHITIMGGVNQNPQVRALERGIDILVATPGRLLDLHGQGHVDLSDVDFFVLDEADRMLDMGFIHDVRRVLKVLPRDRQNLLFSATMPRSIVELAASFLHDPVHIEVTPQSTTVERIDQQIMFVERADKKRLLADLLREREVDRAIVFTRTKHGANRLVQQLDRVGLTAAAIHGNKSQNARERALGGFRDGKIKILIATNIAARGLDVDGVSHVVNYDLPNEPEAYVHRIGRTGRAGRAGQAISFCDQTEGDYLRDIEKLTGVPLEVVDDHPYHFPGAIPAPPSRGRRSASGRSNDESRRGGRGRGRSRGRSKQGGGGGASSDGSSSSSRRRRRRGGSSNRGDARPTAANAAGTNDKASNGSSGKTEARSDKRTGGNNNAQGNGWGGDSSRRRRRRRRPSDSGASADR